MLSFIKRIISSFYRRRHFNKIVKESISKNEKILSQLSDDVDYDGMGNYGRFPSNRK